MIKNDNILDELFRSKLDGHTQPPPSHVWDKIREKQQAGKRKRMLLYWKVSGIAAAVLLAFLIGWELQDTHRNVNVPLVETGHDNVEEQTAQSAAEPLHETEPIAEIQERGRKIQAVQSQISSREEFVPVRKDEHTEEIEFTERESLTLLAYRGVELDNPDDGNLESELAAVISETEVLSEADRAILEMNRKQLAEEARTKSEKSWSLGAVVSPSYSVNQTSHDTEYASNMTRSLSKDELQMGGGLTVEYKAGSKWSVQSGVYYSQLGQSSNNSLRGKRELAYDAVGADYDYFNTAVEVDVSGMMMNASAGVVEIDNLPNNVLLASSIESISEKNEVTMKSADFEQHFEYIEIPLIVRYQLLDADWGVQLLGGLNTGFLVGNDTYMQNSDGRNRVGYTKDMNRVSYSTSIGVGLAYSLSDKIQIRFEPQIKYYLGSLNGNPSVSFKPYSFGIYTGINYRF